MADQQEWLHPDAMRFLTKTVGKHADMIKKKEFKDLMEKINGQERKSIGPKKR